MGVVEYYTQFQGMRTRLVGLPGWARMLIFIAALPGIALLALSILAILVSLAALLLLTVPLYRVLRVVTGTETVGRSESTSTTVFEGFGGDRRKRVDATVIDAAAPDATAD